MADSSSVFETIFQTTADLAGADAFAAALQKGEQITQTATVATTGLDAAMAKLEQSTRQFTEATLSENAALQLEQDALAGVEQHLQQVALQEMQVSRAAARAEADAISMASKLKQELLSTLPVFDQVEKGAEHMVTSAGSKRRALFALSDAIHGEVGRAGFELFEMAEMGAGSILELLTGPAGWMAGLAVLIGGYKLLGGSSEEASKKAEAGHKAAAAAAENQAKAEAAIGEQGFKIADQWLQQFNAHLAQVEQRANAGRTAIKGMIGDQAGIDKDQVDIDVASGTTTKEGGALQKAQIDHEAEIKKSDQDLEGKDAEIAALRQKIKFHEAQIADQETEIARVGLFTEEGQQHKQQRETLISQKEGEQDAIKQAETDKQAIELHKAAADKRLAVAQAAYDAALEADSQLHAKENVEGQMKLQENYQAAGNTLQHLIDEANAKASAQQAKDQAKLDHDAAAFDDSEDESLRKAGDADRAARNSRYIGDYQKRHGGRSPRHLPRDEDADPGDNLAGEAYGQHRRGDASAAKGSDGATKKAGDQMDHAGKASKDLAAKVEKFANDHGLTFEQALKALEAQTKVNSATQKAFEAMQKQLDDQAKDIANIRSSQ